MKLWIRIDAALPRDPEVAALAIAVGIKKAEAIGLLVCVWSAIAEHRPSGDVSDVPPAVVEDWAGYEPRGKAKRGQFAAEFSRLFTRNGAVRGWKDRQGKLIERMEKDRNRKTPSTEIPQSFRGNSAPTERDVTERNDTEEQKAYNDIARGVLKSKLPDEYHPDLDAFLRSLGSETRQLAWVKNLDAKITGMHPPAVDGETVGHALRQLAANGEPPNWKRFEGYLRRTNEAPATAKPAAGKKAPWLVAKEQADHDDYLNRQPDVQAKVEQAKSADPEWWKRMQSEAKTADRWAIPYAYDQLTSQA